MFISLKVVWRKIEGVIFAVYWSDSEKNGCLAEALYIQLPSPRAILISRFVPLKLVCAIKIDATHFS